MKKTDPYYKTNRASKFIYGIILMFAFLISQSHEQNTSVMLLAFLALVASFSFAFAEIYSEMLGSYIKNRGRAKKTERQEIVNDSLAMMSTGVIVSTIFILSWLELYTQRTAFKLSYAVLLGLLFLFSFWAYRLVGFSVLKAIVIASFSVALGIFVVLLKYNFGH
ncbi:hypothetical protein KBC51_00880 [Candidatus Saccharibacteria bacterium]|nr:hypothetical protein [Candidatus Saccharibacteria bacterium]